MHLCPAFVILKNSYKIQYVKKKKITLHVSVFSSQNVEVSKWRRVPIYPRGNNLWYRLAQDTYSLLRHLTR